MTGGTPISGSLDVGWSDIPTICPSFSCFFLIASAVPHPNIDNGTRVTQLLSMCWSTPKLWHNPTISAARFFLHLIGGKTANSGVYTWINHQILGILTVFAVFSWYFMACWWYFDDILWYFHVFHATLAPLSEAPRPEGTLGIGARRRRWAHPAATETEEPPVDERRISPRNDLLINGYDMIHIYLYYKII